MADQEDSASADMPGSKVLVVLTQGRKDLWNAQLPGLAGTICHPVRDYILDPSFQLASIILPPILGVIPGSDPMVAYMINCMMFFPRMIYGVAPRDVDLLQSARNDILINSKAGIQLPRFTPPSDIASAFRGAIAFTLSATADIIGAIMDHKKMAKWFEALTEFKAYLSISGVGDELEEAMMKPMLRGRLLDNAKILNDIQEIMYADRCERICKYPADELEGPIKEGWRMMRFATAAYGTEMIRSALDREAHPLELETQLKAIAFHSDVSGQDIRILYINDGGDMKVLRHFVAIDRKTKSVVLALRGTLSISGALVDMQAMDCEYCCGRAHTGISQMADNVWSESGDKIIALFQQEEELKDFAFVITGHSLGAGTACLLNIKCHVEKLLGDRTVKCYGFAPPPTYCTGQALEDPSTAESVKTAIENSMCYIHDNDCVPHLSVQSIRRLASLMDAVDNITEYMWAYRRFRIFWEWDAIPEDLVVSVKETEKTCTGGITARDQVHGASKLIIPAKVVIWMRKNFVGTFEAFGCDPCDVADQNIFVCQDMVSDHLPEQYEDALDALAN